MPHTHFCCFNLVGHHCFFVTCFTTPESGGTISQAHFQCCNLLGHQCFFVSCITTLESEGPATHSFDVFTYWVTIVFCIFFTTLESLGTRSRAHLKCFNLLGHQCFFASCFTTLESRGTRSHECFQCFNFLGHQCFFVSFLPLLNLELPGVADAFNVLTYWITNALL